MENIFISCYSDHERHSAIELVKRIAGKYGDILDAKLFSDVSMSMTIGIEEHKIDGLYRELSENLVTEKFEYLNSASKKERTVFLNVTFTKGTGNLRIKVPAVPG